MIWWVWCLWVFEGFLHQENFPIVLFKITVSFPLPLQRWFAEILEASPLQWFYFPWTTAPAAWGLFLRSRKETPERKPLEQLVFCFLLPSTGAGWQHWLSEATRGSASFLVGAQDPAVWRSSLFSKQNGLSKWKSLTVSSSLRAHWL